MNNFEEKQLLLRYFKKTTPSKPPLHNFELPGDLRWGNQRFLKCIKVDSKGDISPIERKPSSAIFYDNKHNGLVSASEDYDFANRKSGVRGDFKKDGVFRSYCMDNEYGLKRSRVGDGDDGIEISEVREKVILDLQSAADKMKDSILMRGTGSFEDVGGKGESLRVKPWNLRTRRATNRPVGDGDVGGVKILKLDVIKNNGVDDGLRSSKSRAVAGEVTPRLRSESGEKKEREKFSVGLTRREIEEDFMAMVRHRPSRRPKKRAKYIQKELDTLFPGLGLKEITADMYKVTETQ